MKYKKFVSFIIIDTKYDKLGGQMCPLGKL